MAEVGCVALTLYSRHWCHLCDDMLKDLQSLQVSECFEVAVIDVDSEPALAQRFGERVPVLTHGERELCHFRLERSALADYLREIR